MADASSRRTVLAGLTVLPTLAAPALALTTPTDLGEACAKQVKRLAWWDANPGILSDDEAEAEMDRWGAMFRRAVEEPSACPGDLAGKAQLMLADLERFHPEVRYPTDDFRLMRVILREVIAMGGQA